MNSSKHFLGIGCTLLYIIIASSQSVGLNYWLHNADIFLVIGLSFSIVTLLFLSIGLIWKRHFYFKLRPHWKMIMGLNIVSFFSWLFYFTAVKFLEPSVAVTLTQGLGPVSMTVWHLYRRQPVSKVTCFSHLIILVAAAGMCFYTVFSRVQFYHYGFNEVSFGIIIAVLCSISITATVKISSTLAVHQIPAPVLLSTRFWFLIIFCGITLGFQQKVVLTPSTFYLILLIALIGVSASTYILQKGIELATPLAVSTMLALSPLAVLITQSLNVNFAFSPAICVLISIIVICSLTSTLYDSYQILQKDKALCKTYS